LAGTPWPEDARARRVHQECDDVFSRELISVSLAAAIESKADYLVSGDKDMTSLFPLKEIKIATPREFWTVISKIHPI
jgi:predicted nucleic acid-binding protein